MPAVPINAFDASRQVTVGLHNNGVGEQSSDCSWCRYSTSAILQVV
jgi:hypothetical protein